MLRGLAQVYCLFASSGPLRVGRRSGWRRLRPLPHRAAAALDRLPELVQIGMSIRAAALRPQPMIFMNVSLLLL
jgi:hypothetical protein